MSMNVTTTSPKSLVPTSTEATTSYLNAFTQKMSNATGKVFHAITPISNGFHNLLGRVLPRKIHKPAFERGEGFWSHPKNEKIKTFFGKLTDINSQRENWYKVSPYIAEFCCAVSNAGLIYVGIQHQSPEVVFAGVASIVSHSIPKQWLLTVDKIGVLVALTKLVREHKVLLDHPWLMAPLATAGVVNLIDAHLSREKGQTWPHVVWHLTAAAVSDLFLRYSK